MCAEYDGRQFVGVDLHRRRSVVVRKAADGERLGWARIDNSPAALAEQVDLASAGSGSGLVPEVVPEVVLEATYGWYWAVDTLAAAGARVHLAHPLGVKGFRYRRVKNDLLDAGDLADLLRTNLLPEAWIAPPAVRELRELVRYRAKLVRIRSGAKAQVHAVLAKNGVLIAASDIFGVRGREQLERLALPRAYAARVGSLLGLIDHLDAEEGRFAALIATDLAGHPGHPGHPGYWAIRAIPGVGPTFAAIFVVEIGDITRFAGPAQLCSWAGLTPRHRESDTTVHRGRITKQGSKLVRWAAIEAVQRGSTTKIGIDKQRIAERRGTNIAKVAAARKLLTLVYYGLRDHHIRALDQEAG